MSPSSIISEVLKALVELKSIHSDLRKHYVINISSHTTDSHTLLIFKILGFLLLLLQQLMTANRPSPGILAKVKIRLIYSKVRWGSCLHILRAASWDDFLHKQDWQLRTIKKLHWDIPENQKILFYQLQPHGLAD